MIQNYGRNIFIRIGYGIVFFLTAMLFIFLLLSLFSSRLNFNLKYLYGIIPIAAYSLYLYFFANSYYIKLVDKIVLNSKMMNLKIDEIFTSNVKKRTFNFFGMGASVDEYYFTFFNNELKKNITVSTLGKMPNYNNVNLEKWNHTYIDVFLEDSYFSGKSNNLTGYTKNKNIKTFRFKKNIYNLEDRYLYNYNESIAKSRMFEGIALIFIPFSICFFSFLLLIKYL